MTGTRDDALAALGIFGGAVFARNPCRPADAVVVYRAEGAPADDELLDRFAVVRAPGDALPFEGEPEGAVRALASDWYFGVGAATLGSGRSVVVDGFQVKGVGRTVQAPLAGAPLQVDGRVRAYKAVDELARGRLVGPLLSVPTIPIVAVMQLRAAEGAFLLVRDSVPVRVSHLAFLQGVAYRFAEPARTLGWRHLVTVLSGAPELDEAVVEAVFDGIFAHALRTTAEARVFGLFLANWADNGDLRARIFDFEDISFHFGEDAAPSPEPRTFRGGDDPFEYFARVPFGIPRPSYGTSALHAVVNATVAVETLARGIGYDARVTRTRYGWSRLERWYEAELARAMARLVGVDLRREVRQQVGRALAEEMPLAPGAPTRPFLPSAVLEAFEARLRGAPAVKSREGTIGKLLAAEAGAATEPLRARAAALRAALDGASLHARIAELRREALRVGEAPAAGAPREAAYRELLRRAAEVPAALLGLAATRTSA